MIRNLEAALFFGGLALAACDGGQPLVFVSADTLGIDVSVSTSAQPLTLTFGWKENNVSFVPVTAYDKAGIPYEIRGCGQTGLGDSKVNPCAALKGTGSPGSTDTASPRVAANNADPELEVTPKPTLLTAAMTS